MANGQVLDLDAPQGQAVVPQNESTLLRQQQKTPIIPLGYIPIELSTGGKLGVPKVIYCRNFSTGDLVELSMFNDSILPERVIAVLSSLIYGQSNVAEWPDKCIIELLIRIYVNYFTPTLTQIAFPWDDTDVEYLRAAKRDADAEALETGRWIPRLDLDLRSVKIRSLDSEIKGFVTIRKRNTDGSPLLEAKFIAYPKFGDLLVLRKAVADKFDAEDKAFARLTQQIETRDRYLNEGKDVSNLPPVLDTDYIKWQTYQIRKAVYMAKATRALSLVAYNGTDLTKKTLDERIAYVESPLFDVTVSQKIDEQHEKLDFGVVPDVEVINPVTKQPCTRRFSFRFMDIVQAVLSSSSDGYDISYDD